MALSRSRVRQNVKGGGLFKITELTSGGAATTMDDAGYIESLDLVVDPTMADFVEASGSLINRIRAMEKDTIKVVLQQSTADEINLVLTAAGKFFHAYYQVLLDNPTATYQEFYWPLVKIDPGLTLKYGGGGKRLVELNMTVLMPAGAVTIAPSGLSVVAGSYFTMADTATTPLGQITTAVGTIYSAAL
jgi:hypothetical protein